MTIDVAFHAQEQILIVRVTGTFGVEDMRNFFAHLARETDCPPNTDTIWDMRAADLSGLDYGKSQDILALRREATERMGARLAIVVGDALGVGVSRGFQSVFGIHSGQNETDVRVCKGFDEAHAWILGR